MIIKEDHLRAIELLDAWKAQSKRYSWAMIREENDSAYIEIDTGWGVFCATEASFIAGVQQVLLAYEHAKMDAAGTVIPLDSTRTCDQCNAKGQSFVCDMPDCPMGEVVTR